MNCTRSFRALLCFSVALALLAVIAGVVGHLALTSAQGDILYIHDGTFQDGYAVRVVHDGWAVVPGQPHDTGYFVYVLEIIGENGGLTWARPEDLRNQP